VAQLAVIGSINMDVVNQVVKHPMPGETIHGRGTSYHPGGKGANQAVAAARAGAAVRMAGAVGTDFFGPVLLDALAGHGVHTGTVLPLESTSGLAFITVDAEGENSIILSAGANGRFTPERLRSIWPELEGCSAVLLQNEIPWDTTFAAMKLAQDRGMRIYFNPAPALRPQQETFPLLHCLILNETEAGFITGRILSNDESEEEVAIHQLLDCGAESVILTLGGKGLLYGDRNGGRLRLPAYQVQPVDTTAAGDTFIGAYAAAKEQGNSVEDALRFAAAAAAIAVTRNGAQESVPSRAEILAFLRDRSF